MKSRSAWVILACGTVVTAAVWTPVAAAVMSKAPAVTVQASTIANSIARNDIDASGLAITAPLQPPQRIVALAPSLAELAAEFTGADLGRIVGVSEYTDYPPALKAKPSIGSYSRFSLEKVVSLKPDLVLATTDGNSKEQVLRLRELGLHVVTVAGGNLTEVLKSFKLIARAMGAPARGDEMVRALTEGVGQARARAARRIRHPSILLQVGDDPLVVVGSHSFLNEAVEMIGARNLYGDAKDGYPRPSLEDVLKRDPEQILVLAIGQDLAQAGKIAAAWQRLPTLQAVKKSAVKVLAADTLVRPSLRWLQGLLLLEQAVYAAP